MTNLRYMMVFFKVVETGSISAAADALNISKSVVSQQLKNLETSLGAALLNRTTRRQVLTPIGHAFFEHCRQIHSISEQAWHEVRDAKEIASGPLTISAPHALIDAVVAPALGDLLQKNPGIQLKLTVSDIRINLVEAGVDIAIRVGEMPDSNYRQRRIGEFYESLWADKNYIKNTGITQYKIIEDRAFRQTCEYIANHWQGYVIKHELFYRKMKSKAVIDFRPSRRADSMTAVRAMMECGCGLAWLPSFSVSEQSKSSINVLPDFQSIPTPVFAVHAYGDHCPFLVELGIDAIKHQMQKIQN